jgi:hypothetical protein
MVIKLEGLAERVIDVNHPCWHVQWFGSWTNELIFFR